MASSSRRPSLAKGNIENSAITTNLIRKMHTITCLSFISGAISMSWVSES